MYCYITEIYTNCSSEECTLIIVIRMNICADTKIQEKLMPMDYAGVLYS